MTSSNMLKTWKNAQLRLTYNFTFKRVKKLRQKWSYKNKTREINIKENVLIH